MKRLILPLCLAICLIVSVGICLTVYADDTGTVANATTAESATTSNVDVVRDMINALPDNKEIEKMGYSDKYKTYVDMQAADAAFQQLSEAEKDSLGVLLQVIDNVKYYFNTNPLPSGEVSYGFLMNQTEVTSTNRSGEDWSYDPDTQTLTIGDENEISVLFDTIPKNTDNYWKKQYKNIDGTEREVFYAAVLQPVVLTRDESNNTCTFSPDRPSNLKIVIKRTVIFGNVTWSSNWSQYSSECGKYFEMGGIVWDGDLEITDNGKYGKLWIYATTYGIYANKTLNIHDAELEVKAYNNAIYCSGDLNITNATVDVQSYSLGAQHYDLRLKYDDGGPAFISDSMYAIDCGNNSCTIKDSTVTADAAWNRVYTKEDIRGDFGYTVASIGAKLYVYNSFVSATAHIDEGWERPSKQKANIYGIWGSLKLYDDAFVISKTYADSYFSSHSDFVSGVYFYGWFGSTCYGYGNAVLICTTEARLGLSNKAIWDDRGRTIYAGEGVQYNISPPENYSGDNRRIVEYRKDDTLYLRDQDGTKQASWKMDFSDCVDLESNVVNEADFTSQVDGKPSNVRVVSGNFTFNALPNGEADRFFETLGGSLTVQLDSGENYGDVHVFTAPSSSITLQGKGIIENLIVKPHVSIDHKTYYVETGSLTIDVATVKNCQIDEAYKDNVSFEGGNVKVDISDTEYYRQYFKLYYNTIIYDFNSLSEKVDFVKARMSNGNYSSDGAQLIDGYFYCYAKKADAEGVEDFIENVYVKPSTGYSYYVLPENPDKLDGITTYTFKRATETLNFISEEKIKYAYVSVGEQDVTIDSGYVQTYVTDTAINGGDGFALPGSETQTLPEGYFAKWFYTDEKTGKVTVLVGEGDSLLYTINNVELDDEFRTYTCEVYRKDRWYETSIGSYSIKPRIMIMSVSPSPYTVYVKVGDTIPLKLTVDENCRDNWRQDLVVMWQARKDADSDWIELPNGANTNPCNLKITDEEMISWEYRAMLYQLIRPLDRQPIPDYYSDSIFFNKRDTKFDGELKNISDKNGKSCSISVNIVDGYTSAIDCYWERSQDGGKTWAKVIADDDNFSILALTFSKIPVGGGSSVSYTSSTSITVKLNSSLNGDILRAVIYDKQSDTYMYTNESLITITDHVHEWSTDEIIAKKDAECEKDGALAHWHCNSCGNDYAADQETMLGDIKINALGHNQDGSVAHVDAKCTETGVVGGTYCTRCNDGKEAAETTIKALGHNQDGSVAHVDAKCTETGVVGGTYCTRCNEGKSAAEATIKALGHNQDGSVAHVDAKCTETGVVGGTYCTRCNDGKEAAEATINALGHSLTHHDRVEATSTSTGNVEYWSCSRCNKNFGDKDGNNTIADIVIAKRAPSVVEGSDTEHVKGVDSDLSIKLDALKEDLESVFVDGVEVDSANYSIGEDGLEIIFSSSYLASLADGEHTVEVNCSSGKATSSFTVIPTPESGLSGGAIAGIAIGSVAVAGLGGFAIFWFVIKKKKWVDLVAVFKDLFAKK